MQRPGMSARAALIAIACAATYVFTHAAAPLPEDARTSMSAIPMALTPWSGEPAPPLEPEVARVLAADEYVHRYYHGPGGMVEMDVAYYARPRVGANMHSPLNCLPGNGWSVTQSRTLSVDTAAARWPVRELTVQRGDLQYVLAYWFQSRDRVVSDELASRFHLLTDALRRKPTDTALVRLIMPAAASLSEPEALGAFAARVIPELATRLR